MQKGLDEEKISDNEVYDTVQEINKILNSSGHQSFTLKVAELGVDAARAQLASLKGRADFVFNLAEGIGGDLTKETEIPKALTGLGIPYSGCDAGPMELCKNKVLTKEFFLKHKILTPAYQIFKSPDEKLRKLAFPLIVKPSQEGGSVGITPASVVDSKEKLYAKIGDIVEQYKQPALVEEYIDGREINAAVLGNGSTAEVLPLSEILFNFPKGMPRIVSFDAKWSEDSFEFRNTPGKCPADLPAKTTGRIQELAKSIVLKSGCRDYTRVDFRLRGAEIFALEINYNPCINPKDAGFVRSAKAAGYSYESLVQKIVKVAMSRGEP